MICGGIFVQVQECSVTVNRGLSFDNELEVVDFQCSPYEAYQKVCKRILDFYYFNKFCIGLLLIGVEFLLCNLIASCLVNC